MRVYEADMGTPSEVDKLQVLLADQVVYTEALNTEEAGFGPRAASVPAALRGKVETLTFRLVDQNGGQLLLNSTVWVDDVRFQIEEPANTPPFFITSAPVSGTEDALYSYPIRTGDAGWGSPGSSLSIVALEKPAWLTLVDHGDGTALLAGTPGNGDVGTHGVMLGVLDEAYGFAAQSFTVDIAAVNDAPVLDSAKSPTLSAISEDAPAPAGPAGMLVAALVDFALPAGQVDNVTDVDSCALLGIAVTAADGRNGAWYWSTDSGSTWAAMGTPTDGVARLLAADGGTRLYFRPNRDWNGTVAITFRAWDQTIGTNSGTADTSTNGGTTAFSAATDDALLTVTAVNDPPVNDLPPTVSGEHSYGGVLTASAGVWNDTADTAYGGTSAITCRYQWRRTSSGGGEGAADIGEATGASYVLGSSDVGMYVGVWVTAEDTGVGVPPSASAWARSPWQLVGRASQAITFPGIGDQLATATLELAAVATSGLPVSYEVAGPAVLNGNTLSFTGTGSAAVTALQAGDSNYLAAAPVVHSFAVVAAAQLPLVFSPAPTSPQVYNTLQVLAVTGGSGSGALSFTVVSGPGEVVGGNGLRLASGSGVVLVRATKAGDGVYAAASVDASIQAAKATQAITFTAPIPRVFGDADFAHGAAASSALPVTVTSSDEGVARVVGEMVHIVAAGACTLAASQPGNEDWAPAPQQQRPLTVGKAIPAITWVVPADTVYGTALGTAQLNATANTTGAFTYTPAAGVMLNAGPAQVLHVDFTPADAANWQGAAADVPITVAKAPLTVTALPQSRRYGEPCPATYPVGYAGFVNGDEPADLDALPTAGCAADACSDVGGYPITVAVGTDRNYELAPVAGLLTVAPASLICTPVDMTKDYRAPLPACEIVYEGLVCGDTGPAVPPSCQYGATLESPTGEYAITLVGGADPNYELVLRPGTLSIVDTGVPSTVAITRESPAAVATNAVEVTFAVTFSEPVVGLTAASFAVDGTGTQTAAFVLEAVPTGIDWKLQGAADVWSMRVQTAPGDGSLSIDLVNGLEFIHDSGGNTLQTPFAAGESYDVDRTAPTVTGLSPAPGTEGVERDQDLVVTFSESVFAGSGSVVIHRAADGSVFETIPVASRGGVAIAGSTVALSHAPFVAGDHYYVVMAAGCLVDTVGNPFAGIAGPAAWPFRALQWHVTFSASLGGSLDGDLDQWVGHGGDCTPVAAVAAPGWVLDHWNDGSTQNPRLQTSVVSDMALTAAFREASIPVGPVGEFRAWVDARAVADGRGWWDLGGIYATSVEGNPLTLALTHDPSGKLSGNATYTLTKDTVVTMPIKGSVKGASGSITMKGTLKGATPDKTVSVALTMNLTVDTANRRLTGPLTGSVKSGGVTTAVNQGLALDIPLPMDGTWTLDVQLAQSGTTVTGTARLTLSNGVECAFTARGKTGPNSTVVLSLTGDRSDAAAKAIKVKATITPLEGGWARLESFSGKGYGQTVAW